MILHIQDTRELGVGVNGDTPPKSHPPGVLNVALVGERVFANEIQLRTLKCDSPGSPCGPASTIGALIRERLREIRDREEGHVTTETESGVT
jgi:hypothetical protein